MPGKRKNETVAQLAKKRLDTMWERALAMQMPPPKKNEPQEVLAEPPKKKELTSDQQKKKEYAHNYYMAHREERLERTKKWQREHRDRANKHANDYYHRNSKRVNKTAYDKLRNDEEKWEQKKAQQRAYQILEEMNLATQEELCALKELFHLYNVQYINDIILSSLELLYVTIEIISIVQGDSSGSRK